MLMKITLFIYCTLAFYLFLNEANAQIPVTKNKLITVIVFYVLLS